MARRCSMASLLRQYNNYGGAHCEMSGNSDQI